MTSFINNIYHIWALLSFSLLLVFTGLVLKGFLRKQKLKRFLLHFLLGGMMIILAFIIMKQAEHFRHHYQSFWNISFILLNPFLKTGLFLERWLPASGQQIVKTAFLTEESIWFFLAGISLLLLGLFILLQRRRKTFPLIILLVSLFLGVIGIILSNQNNISSALQFGVGAVICVIVYALLTRKESAGPTSPRLPLNISRRLLGIIILFALCINTYQLYSISARFDRIEATYAMHAIRVLKSQYNPNFWLVTSWRGIGMASIVSPIYLGWVVLFFKIFGVNLVALRLVSALCGAITVFLVYRLSKVLFDEKLALIAAALFTFSPLHTSYTRSSLLVSITTMAGFLILFLLFRAIKYRDRRCYFFLGITLAFAGYLYSPITILVPLTGFFLLVYIIFKRGFLFRHWSGILILFLAIYLVIELFHIPFWEVISPKLFVYESVWHRTKSHLYTPQPDYTRAIPLIIENSQKLFFSFIRDGRFNYNMWPGGNLYFNPLLAVSLFWGLIYSLINLNQARFRILLFLSAAFVLPNILSRPPVVTRRLIFLLPLLYFFSALPLYCFWQELNKLFRNWGNKVAFICILLITAAVGSYNASIYFHSQALAGRWEVERFFDEYVKVHIENHYVYIVPYNDNSKITIDFLLWEKVQPGKRESYYRYLKPNELKQLEPDDIVPKQNVAFICSSHQINRRDMEKLKDRLGEGRIEEYRDKFGRVNAYALFIDRNTR